MTKTQKISAYSIGISLIIMAVAGGFAYGQVFQSIHLGSETTLNHFINNINLFKAGNLAWIIVILTDFIVSIAVYLFFKTYNKPLAILTSISRLIYTFILLYAFTYLLSIRESLGIDLILNHMDNFELIWFVGLILFGLHLVLLGLLLIKSHYSKIMGILVIVAGFSYIIVDGMSVIIPEQEALITLINNILMLPMVVGELGFGIYLLIKAKKSS